MGVRSDTRSRLWEGGKYLVYPLTLGLARATGAGVHLLHALVIGTALRYLVNWAFVALSKVDSFAEHRRIHRKNPPQQQLERETDWDGPVVLSPLAFVLVDIVTPWLGPDRVVPCDAAAVAWLFLAHYGAVEPVYYAFHLWLHKPVPYAKSHHHHHASIVTEAISGTSHPFLESIAYLANFSLAFLVPAWFGHFSPVLIPLYFVWFDVMNCAGHCNFECFPAWSQRAPLKYVVYSTTYHSLHHSKYKCNYALFCPLWDYLCGTVHRTTEALHESVLAQAREAPEVVFLAHGHDDASMLLHVPWLSPLRSARTHGPFLPWGLDIFLLPIYYGWASFCRAWLDTACVQRYQYRGTRCATWCLPVAGRFYLDARERPALKEMVQRAVEDADAAGVRYVGLAALNKAEWLNGGGRDVERALTAQGRQVRVVHGNALTAAAVLESIARADPAKAAVVAVTGATSKIGRAVALSLAHRGNVVLMLTAAEDRFDAIVRECAATYGADCATRLKRIASYAEGADAADIWLLGKLVFEATLAKALRGRSPRQQQQQQQHKKHPIVLDFAVPHLVPSRNAPYIYHNAAALKYGASDTDLTFCHDIEKTVPACLAATIIHARDDDRVHETGEVDVEGLAAWWKRATFHGFDLADPVVPRCPSSSSSGGREEEKTHDPALVVG